MSGGFVPCTSSIGVGLLERLRGARDQYATEDAPPTRAHRPLFTAREIDAGREIDPGSDAARGGDAAEVASSPHAHTEEHYVASMQQFFAHDEAHERLMRFYSDPSGAAIFPVVAYFVVRHGKTRTFHCKRFDGTLGTYCPADEYGCALRKFTKRYYDFTARGKAAARVAASPGRAGTPRAPVAQLNAMAWFIELGFDRHFWDRADAMAEAHRVLHAATKRQYSESHKRRRRALREAAEKEVVRMRSHRAARPDTSARLTGEERRRVVELVATRKRQQKAAARAARARAKRRKTKAQPPKSAALVQQTAEAEQPEISL